MTTKNLMYLNISYNEKRDRFLRMLEEKPWVTDAVVARIIAPRRSWYKGLTAEEFGILVADTSNKLRVKMGYRKIKKVPLVTISKAKMNINYFAVPGVHVAGSFGINADGNREYRYFNIRSLDDAEDTKDKYEHKIVVNRRYSAALNDHIESLDIQKVPARALERLQEAR